MSGDDTSGEVRTAGVRTARNLVLRVLAEITGKVASLVLFAALAREAGQSDLGVFVFAFAFVQLAIVPVEIGVDRWFIREVAREKSALGELTGTILLGKLLLSVPVFAVAMGIVLLVRDDALARETVAILGLGLLLDSLTRTTTAVFLGLEQGGLVALSIVLQRFLNAGLGIAALLAGYAVVAVALTYTIASAVAFAVTVVRLVQIGGAPRFRAAARRIPSVLRGSSGFGLHEVFTNVFFRADAVMLSVLATDAAVGRYGAAYRLLESSFFLTYSLSGTFSPMYAYLDERSSPTLRAMFQRSVKAALGLLVPLSVVFAALAEPLCVAFFGQEYAEAADTMLILAPVALALGLFTLASALVMSRHSARDIVLVTAGACVANIGINLVLIPDLGEQGAAAAKLASLALFGTLAVRLAVRSAGGISWRSTLPAPLLAGGAMTAAAVVLSSSLVLAALVSSLVYLVVYVAVERLVSPGDLRFLASLVRRRGALAAGA